MLRLCRPSLKLRRRRGRHHLPRRMKRSANGSPLEFYITRCKTIPKSSMLCSIGLTTVVKNFQVGSVFGVFVALILQFHEIILLTMVTRDKMCNIQVGVQHTSCYYVSEKIN